MNKIVKNEIAHILKNIANVRGYCVSIVDLDNLQFLLTRWEDNFDRSIPPYQIIKFMLDSIVEYLENTYTKYKYIDEGLFLTKKPIILEHCGRIIWDFKFTNDLTIQINYIVDIKHKG